MPLHVGDFILDTQQLIRTGEFPEIASLGELEHFMRSRGTCDRALQAARIVWKKFEGQL
jgi:hypothetical protein